MGNRYVNRAFATLQKFLRENAVKDKILAKETTMRVGGSADIFAIADSLGHLRIVLDTAKEWGIPLFVIGKGSNLLVSDSGFPGIVLRLGRDFMAKRIDGSKIHAGAAATLPSLVQTASRHSLGGLCFAVGIPGGLGGALVMNAGAHGSCIGDMVENAVVYSRNCELKVLEKNQIKFEYRKANFEKDDIIIAATLALDHADTDLVKQQMEEYFTKRKNRQPLQLPNAGSVFRNPKDTPAGKLIEEAGCKGMSVGDAEVSTKHANFIVNRGHATASEIYTLLRIVQKRVFERHGVILEPEIELIGEFDGALMLE